MCSPIAAALFGLKRRQKAAAGLELVHECRLLGDCRTGEDETPDLDKLLAEAAEATGEASATVTRRNGRYFAGVNVTKTLRDVYDYTDNDGEKESNAQIDRINNEIENQRDPWLHVDSAKLNILAATGRAKPFEVTSSPWQERYTVELRWVPTPRSNGETGHFEIVPNTGTWQRISPPTGRSGSR